jgi:hypothetical protein
MAAVALDEGFTIHAARRVQQRAIPPVIVDYLMEFGESRPAGGGAECYSFSRRGWHRLERYLGPVAKHFEKYRSVYVIVADGFVVTTAHVH